MAHANTVVRVTPTVEVEGRAVTYADRVLPASEPFDIELPDPTQHYRAVVIEVWPKLETACKAPTPEAKQTYRLGMSPSGTGADRVFRASVPALETGQVFCFRLTYGIDITADQMKRFAVDTADRFTHRLEDPALGTQAQIQGALVQEIRIVLASMGFAANSEPTVSAVVDGIKNDGTLVRFITAGATLIAMQEAQARAAAGPPAQAAQAAQNVSAAQANLSIARAALLASLSAGLQSLRLEVGDATPSIRVDTRAGEGTLPDAGNYVSLDTGVALAYPAVGGGRDAWVFPYVGINLYAVPVERKVPLESLVGGALQRLSLTVGFTLTAPPISGRGVQSVIFDRYPMVALGVRIATYVRFTIGSAFYKLNSRDPASTQVVFGAAPFIGLSLDADLVSIVKKGL